jgi:hypothetical protein
MPLLLLLLFVPFLALAVSLSLALRRKRPLLALAPAALIGFMLGVCMVPAKVPDILFLGLMVAAVFLAVSGLTYWIARKVARRATFRA